MQIDTDVLATVVVFVHRGLPQRVVGEHPRASARDHGGRRPRPFIASTGYEYKVVQVREGLIGGKMSGTSWSEFSTIMRATVGSSRPSPRSR
jgi:hypothetical protein